MRPSELKCGACGSAVPVPARPSLTVDIIVEMEDGRGIVLVERRNFPHGWAIPGGFVDYGESAEDAARREAEEETSLAVDLIEQFHTYSRPDRDPRGHTVSIVFLARAGGVPRARDDARDARVFPSSSLPRPLAFDHARIIEDYLEYRRTGKRPMKA